MAEADVQVIHQALPVRLNAEGVRGIISAQLDVPEPAPPIYPGEDFPHDDQEPSSNGAQAANTSSVRVARPRLRNRYPVPFYQVARTRSTSPDGTEAFKDKNVQAFFQHLTVNTPSVFLCIGRPERCRIIQIPFRDYDNQGVILGKMREAWKPSAMRSVFCKIVQVEEVKFCFAGSENPGGNRAMFGVCKRLDLNTFHLELVGKLERVQKNASLAKNYRGHFSDCSQNRTSGVWEHTEMCRRRSSFDIDSRCFTKQCAELKYRIRSLTMVLMLTLAFHTPSLASGQRLLDGLAQSSGIYSSRDMLLDPHRYNPRIADASLNGYYIVEEWRDLRVAGRLLVIILSVSLSFLFLKIFGDWQTAIGATSLVVTTLTLVVHLVVYKDD